MSNSTMYRLTTCCFNSPARCRFMQVLLCFALGAGLALRTTIVQCTFLPWYLHTTSFSVNRSYTLQDNFNSFSLVCDPG